MKKRMQMYGYTENDHLLSSTSVGGAGFIQLPKKSLSVPVESSVPPDVEKLKQELAKKNS